MKTDKGKIFSSTYFKAVLIFLLTSVVLIGGTLIKLVVGDLDKHSLLLAIITSCITILLFMSCMYFYFIHSRRSLFGAIKQIEVILFAFSLSYFINLLIATIDVKYMPILMLAFVLAPLSSRRDIFVTNLFQQALIIIVLWCESGLVITNDLLFTIIMFIIGIFGGSLVAYYVTNIIKRLSYVLKGFIIEMLVILLMYLASFVIKYDFLAIFPYLLITTLCQVLIGLLLQPILEWMFNLVTNSKLVELTDHNSPLIKRLIKEAPGTFNHCLTVANFAEVCAGAIGENPYLARACAYYHDIGKLMNPLYFGENQGDYNPHSELLPEVSAQILRNHTTDGYDLCTKYRIPEEVKHVTIQHHGTLPIIVFYEKAKQLTDSEVDINEFSYHGVIPVTKIAAIIMICDASEAAIRSIGKTNAIAVENLVTSIINDRIKRGQFNNCDITMRDLEIIKETIVNAYGGVFHKRVSYPKGLKDD